MEKCDCLNYCGDDPWLARGKAHPCERRAEQILNENIGQITGIRLERNAECISVFVRVGNRECCVISDKYATPFIAITRDDLRKIIIEGTK